MKKLEFILEPDGTVKRRNIEELDLNVTDDLIAVYGARAPRVVANVFDEGGVGRAHMCLAENLIWWTIEIPRIPLFTSYAVQGEWLVPSFGSSNPMLIWWTPPDSCRMRMLCRSMTTDAIGGGVMIDLLYLFAADVKGELYKLPLPNLHADAKLCSGQDQYTAVNHLQCIQRVLAQFSNSRWNRDLMPDGALVGQLFKFKPNNKDLAQVPVEGDWRNACAKVSVRYSQYLVLI